MKTFFLENQKIILLLSGCVSALGSSTANLLADPDFPNQNNTDPGSQREILGRH